MRRTVKQRTRMFVTKPVRKGVKTGKHKATPSFWRNKRKG